MSTEERRETLLIEIGCEEIPARMLRTAADDLVTRVTGLLAAAEIEHGAGRAYWTPRRLTVRVSEVAPRSPVRRQTVTGPPAKAAWDAERRPTRAAEGFARRHGREADELIEVETPRGPYAALQVEAGGESPGEVIAAGLQAALDGMVFPKTMRWGDGRWRFVRPVHWVLALHGDRPFALEVFGVRSGNRTRGHRFLGGDDRKVPSADAYEEVLREAGVVVDPDERRRRLSRELRDRAGEEGLLVEDEGLLEEVADIVEFPGVVAGSFPARFRDLPGPILRTTLRHHQKAFSVRDEAGGSVNRFAVAVNTDRDPSGHVRRGNEWVVVGRLEDAEFFYREDRKRGLADWAAGLEAVTYTAELGSYAAKALRLERLAGRLAEALGGDEAEVAAARRGGRLAKADLVTGMVGEFPELQGVVGGLYAAADGESEDAAEAIGEHYRPAGADDPVPTTFAGTAVSLADRLDALAGHFAAGARPTGSKDPFGLRRAALGALRIVLEGDRTLDLHPWIEEAAAGYGDDTRSPVLAGWPGARADLHAFLEERLTFLLERDGARYDEAAAVGAACRGSLDARDRRDRARALRGIRGDDDFLSLAAAAKRIRNILGQARERGDDVPDAVDPSAFDQEAESGLHRSADEAGRAAEAATGSGDYRRALLAIAGIRPAVDRFFDDVLVMDPDAGRRARRLALLGNVGRLLHGVVDFSEIVVEGDEAEGSARPQGATRA